MAIVGNETSKGGFAGLRVLSLESRRAQEMAKLIESNGGKATVAPSMREIPLASNTQAIAFARKLSENNFDIVIFLTGVGTRALTRVVETVYPVEQFVAALRKITVVARGPKPVAALKELGVPVTVAVPEPNTWRDLLRTLDEKAESVPLTGRHVAVQEYGTSNPELLTALSDRGAQVTRVPVYEWGLPEDVEPLRAAVTAIARDELDVILFTTGIQVNHLFQVAAEMNQEDSMRRGLSKMLIASIGPVTSERLHEYGLQADIEPTHPKMGYLVSETAQRSAEILRQKRIRTK
ncbi:MAG: Uroporphyrinogen-III synthase [Candidatus Acidoferrum typicum]|nr:Uroporphyrinogen-III synthase [Candidatus Acidoferrum typicum]